MTYVAAAEYKLPLDVETRTHYTSPPVDPTAISAVVPVKDDLPGLRRTVQSLLRLDPPPRIVRVVDDGSSPPVDLGSLFGAGAGVVLERLPRNRGPAAARNSGLRDLGGWVYLTDCGCTHPSDMFERLAAVRSRGPANVVAIGSPVVAEGGGRIGRYMTEQGNLNPPMAEGSPQAIITASALVHGNVAALLGGFDSRFREAGGEDLDFGLRLRQLGVIAWCPDAPVRHAFEESLDDFDRRFRRYGRGMRVLAEKWGVSLEPYEFRARSPDLQDLADRQYRRMLEGYRAGPTATVEGPISPSQP